MPAKRGDTYRVVFSEAVRQQLHDLHRRAAEKGLGDKVLAAARAIVARLESDPLEFGEQRYRLRGLQLRVRDGVYAPLVVRYGVRQKQRVVFVSKFSVLSGAGF